MALRPALLAAHRTACLQHDEFGQATLLNLLLKNLLDDNQVRRAHSLTRFVEPNSRQRICLLVFQVEQAYKLVSKANFPEKASNNQFCRFLYYKRHYSSFGSN